MSIIKIDDDLLFDKHAKIGINKSSSVKSLIRNITNHCYNDLNIDKAFDIENWLEKLLECEVYLSFTKKRHRDHLLHACRIAVLGEIILNNKIKINDKDFAMLDLYRELIRQNPIFIQMFNKYDLDILKMDNKELDERIIQIWYITALFHDIGFVYEAFLESFKNIQFLTKYPNFKEFCMNIDSAIIDFQKTFTISAGYDLCTSCELGRNFDHGKIGACLIYNLLGETNLSCEAAAIVTDCHTSNERIDFTKNPLSFLLIILDETQEWGRPIIGKKLRDQALSEKLSSRYKDYPFLGPELDYLTVNYYFDDKLNLEFDLNYGDNYDILEDTNFNFPMMLYLKYKNLQRLKIDCDCSEMKNAFEKLKFNFSDFNFIIRFMSEGKLADKWHQQCDSLLFLSLLDNHKYLSKWLLKDINYKDKRGSVTFTINKTHPLKRIEGNSKTAIEESNDRNIRDYYISDEVWNFECNYEKLADPNRVKFTYHIIREISSTDPDMKVHGIYEKFDDRPISYNLEEIKVDGLNTKDQVGIVMVPEGKEVNSFNESIVIYIPFNPPLAMPNKKKLELKLSMELSLEKEKFALKPRTDGVINTRRTRKLSGTMLVKWDPQLFDNNFKYGVAFKGRTKDITDLENKIKSISGEEAILASDACAELIKKEKRDSNYEFKFNFENLEFDIGAGIIWMPM